MGISGNLKTMALAELLQWLSMGQKTGTLVIDNGQVGKKVYFEDGLIIASASTDPKEYLGRFLVSHGYISEEKLDEALARQGDEKKLVGQILVNMEEISEEDLQQILRLKSEESIYEIFTWGEGDFEFLDGELPEETMVRMALDVQWIVLEGSRRLDEWRRIRELVPSPLCVPVSIVGFEELELDEVDRRILAWVDDDRTVEEISHECQTALFQVASVFAQQVEDGTLKVVRPRTIEVEVPVEVPAAAPPPSEQPAAEPEAAPAPGADAPSAPQPAPPAPAGGVEIAGGRTLRFAAPPPGAGAPQAESPPAETPPPALSEAESSLEEAEAALASGDLETALAAFRRAQDADGADASVESAVQAGESKVKAALERDGIKLSTVPKLKCGMEELTQLRISPQEGFMLTRADGTYDLQSILKMSPMPKLDAQMLFWRLKKSGHVAV